MTFSFTVSDMGIQIWTQSVIIHLGREGILKYQPSLKLSMLWCKFPIAFYKWLNQILKSNLGKISKFVMTFSFTVSDMGIQIWTKSVIIHLGREGILKYQPYGSTRYKCCIRTLLQHIWYEEDNPNNPKN
jgi:hypothetical protein